MTSSIKRPARAGWRLWPQLVPRPTASVLVASVMAGAVIAASVLTASVLAASVLVAQVLVAPGPAFASTGSPAARAAAPAARARSMPAPSLGPYAAGTATVSGAGTRIVLWYPAAPTSVPGHHHAIYDVRDWLPPSVARRVPGGVFTYPTAAYAGLPADRDRTHPLVLFAHGLYSFPDQSTFLTAWLASWGYVVAAPAFPLHDLAAFYERAAGQSVRGPTDAEVLRATETLVERLDHARGSVLGGVVRPGAVAVIGHSQGGIDAMQFSEGRGVSTYVALAAGFVASHPPLPRIPSLYLAAGRDNDIPIRWVEDVYATAPSPKRLVVLPGAGHLAFTDLCQIGIGHGGLAALGRDIGGHPPAGAPFVGRALDGCGAGYPAPAASWAVIRAAVLGDLRRALPTA